MSFKLLLGVLRAPYQPADQYDPLSMIQLITQVRWAADQMERMAKAIDDANEIDTSHEVSCAEMLKQWREKHRKIIDYVLDA